MPNWSGYSSAVINYALNAPAVGTNFPLSIDGTQIAGGLIPAANLPLANSTTRGAIGYYEESSWSVTFASSSNITGTAVATGGSYTRIGNTVFVRIASITGCSITTAGAQTFLDINSTGLPGVTNSTVFYGTSYCAIVASPNEILPVAIADSSPTHSRIFLGIGSAAGLGVVNGDAINISSVFFTYTI